MKQILTIFSLLFLFSACKKVAQDAPTHIALPCEANYGTADLTFYSNHYNITQNYSLKKCDISMYFKSTPQRPYLNWYYGSMEISVDSIQLGIDSIQRFKEVAPGDTIDQFADGIEIPIRIYQVRMHTNINDPELYAYISNNEPGSYFKISTLTDTTVSGSYNIHVSRLKVSPTGSNVDDADHSTIHGTFTNIKIQQRSIN